MICFHGLVQSCARHHLLPHGVRDTKVSERQKCQHLRGARICLIQVTSAFMSRTLR